MASAKRLTEILRVYLVSTRVDVVDTDSLAFQLRNLKTEEVMKILTITEETHGHSVLHIAAQFEHTEITRVIMAALPQQQRIELLTQWDCTPLHTAAIFGKLKASDELLCHLTTWQQIQVLSACDSTGLQPAAQAAMNKHPYHSAMLQQKLISSLTEMLGCEMENRLQKKLVSEREELSAVKLKLTDAEQKLREKDVEISQMNKRLSDTERKLDDAVKKFLEFQTLISALLIHKRKPPVGAESVEIDKLESDYSLGLNGDTIDVNSFAEPMSLKSSISTVRNDTAITGNLPAQPDSTYENSTINGQHSDASDSNDKRTSPQVTLHLMSRNDDPVSLSDQCSANNDGPDINRRSPDSQQTSPRRPPKPKPRKTTGPRTVSIEDNTYHGYSESIHKDYGSIGSTTLPKNFRQRDQQGTKPEQPSSVGPITRQGSDQPITDQY